MAQHARFRTDYKGIGKMLTSPQMQREMRARAEQVQSRAESLAPHESGQYGASFRIEVDVREGAKPRARATVINDAPAAPYVEWGTSRTPRYRVMGRAAGSE